MSVTLVKGRKFLPGDAGTWLDGWHGWTNTYRVIDLARENGFKVPQEYRAALRDYRSTGGRGMSDDDVEAITGHGELSDMATDYLNDLAPEGYSFVWNAGELSLMSDADAELI